MTNKVKVGSNTVSIAEYLFRKYRKYNKQVSIFYDHGKHHENVCQPTLFFTKEYGHHTTLSNADIVIIKDGKVRLIIEIEESENVSPKTILGDFASVLFAEKISIGSNKYSLSDTPVIIALKVKNKGNLVNKYRNLERKINKFLTGNPLICAHIPTLRIITKTPSHFEKALRIILSKEISKIIRDK